MLDKTPRPARSARPEPSFAELFTPKLVTTLREGYRLADFRADALAGLTVAIVALPLSMAIAIASGVGPEKGLFTAIVAGFIISALGGSRFQIGGPAGAFIVLVAAIVEKHGYDGLVIATFMAGMMLIAIGYLRLGTYIRYIPYPVTVGFTAGIAAIIFASQIKELLGLTLDGKEPAALLPKLEALAHALPTVHLPTLFITAVALAAILTIRKLAPRVPFFLVGVVAASIISILMTAATGFEVATIASRFGGIPSTLPAPALPEITFARIAELFPDALALALLGGIESLLSAVVADGMTGRRHRSNCELVAQGAANMASVVFGGITATGTIARTATNVRSGARSPVAGMLHAVFLLVFMLVAAPLAGFVPLAALGAVLAVVAWNMAEKDEFISLLRASMGDRVVLVATFGLTVFHDLTVGITVGIVLGCVLFMHRMAENVEVETGTAFMPGDRADDSTHRRSASDIAEATANDVMVYHLHGPLFFGAAAYVSTALDRLGAKPRAFVLDFTDVPLVDSTGANALEGFVKKLERDGTKVWFAGTPKAVRRVFFQHGLKPPHVRYAVSVADAVAAARSGGTALDDGVVAG